MRNAADTTPPTAAIGTPETDSELSAPVDIVGTASDANFAQYTLLLAPAGTGRYTTIATYEVWGNLKVGAFTFSPISQQVDGIVCGLGLRQELLALHR